MPADGQDVKFNYYTRAKFNALSSKDNNTIYYVGETDGEIKQYLGSKLVSGGGGSSSSWGTTVTGNQINDITTSGYNVWNSAGSTSSTIPPHSQWYHVHTIVENASTMRQVAYRVGSNYIITRYKSSSGWSGWTDFVTDLNIANHALPVHNAVATGYLRTPELRSNIITTSSGVYNIADFSGNTLIIGDDRYDTLVKASNKSVLLEVSDVRKYNTGGSSSYLRLPNDDLLNRSLTLDFYNDSSRKWRGAITMAGWTNSYASWQLDGPSNNSLNTDSDVFRVRSGLGTSWNAWRKIMTSADFTMSSTTTLNIVTK